MADQETRQTEGRSHGGLYFIVGILVAAVAVLGFLYYNGTFDAGSKDVNIKVETPSTGKTDTNKSAPDAK